MTPGTVRTIKLLVVDDVPSVRRGLRMRLSLESDLQVVDDAASREKALAAGATAFVGKHEASEALLLAIRDAAQPAA